MAWREEIIGGVRELRPGPKELRNFGLVLLVAFGIIGSFMLWHDRPAWPYFLGMAVLFGFWGLIWPSGLKWTYKVWMGLAIVLGFFISRILLTLLFYLVVTPIGLFMRLLGKDLLDRKLGDRDSYWHMREYETYNPERTEKMY